MLGALLFGSLLGAGMGMIGAGMNSRAQGQNYELSKESLELQKEQFKYQQGYDKWAKAFAESQYNSQLYQWVQEFNAQQDAFRENMDFQKDSYARNQAFQEDAFAQQMDLARSPVSSVVQDAAKVGINPMAALGMSAGSASTSSASAGSASLGSVSPVNGGTPSSNAHTGFSGGSVPLDTSLMSLISNIVTTGMNVNAEKEIAEKNQSLRQQELDIIQENNRENIRVQDEGNEIKRIESNIHQQLANANDKMTSLHFEEFAHNRTKDIKSYYLEKARMEFAHQMSDKEFAQHVSEFNKKFDQGAYEFEEGIKKADKDRRKDYITSFARTVSDLFGRIFLGSGR